MKNIIIPVIIIVVMCMLFVVFFVVFIEGRARDDVYALLTKEIKLEDVPVSGDAFFEIKIEARYRGGQFSSIALISGTTNKQPASQVEDFNITGPPQ